MYEYIAYNNPHGALMLLQSYGLKIRDTKNLGSALRKLVAQYGERALRQVAELHPDKELIMDVYEHADGGGCNCGCGGKISLGKEMRENFYGVDGTTTAKPSDNAIISHQTNVILLMATILIAAAIITKK